MYINILNIKIYKLNKNLFTNKITLVSIQYKAFIIDNYDYSDDYNRHQ
jgi:hypothetical protein